MKTIKTSAKHYNVTCSVCYVGENGMTIAEYKCESATKSDIKIKKSIRDAFKADGNKVIGIDNITIEREDITTTYKFDIDTDTLIEMLIANGVEYTTE